MVQPALTPYYLQELDDMIGRINSSRNGKRRWTEDPATGRKDYSQTERSTFPDWARCFWRQNRLRADKRDSIEILQRAKRGLMPISEKRREAFGMMIDGKREEEYREELYWKELF